MHTRHALPLICLLLAACSNNDPAALSSPTPAGVPERAALAVESPGALTFVAPASGTAYLRDVPADRIVYRADLRPGQRLAFDPKADQSTLDYQPVQTEGLRRDATYQLYFKPAR
jgi:hypothetical protein